MGHRWLVVSPRPPIGCKNGFTHQPAADGYLVQHSRGGGIEEMKPIAQDKYAPNKHSLKCG